MALSGHRVGLNDNPDESNVLQGFLEDNQLEPAKPQPQGTSSTGSRESIASTTVGGRTYPLRVVPSCHVCNSPERMAIENALVRGWSHTSISRSVAEEGVTPRNIKSHFTNGHMPLTDEVQARLDEDAHERGRVIDEGVEVVMDSLALSRKVRAAVVERMENGDLPVTVKDGLAAEALLARAEAAEPLDQAALVDGFMKWAEAIKRHCTPDQIREIGAEIHNDPALTSLREATERRG